MTVHSAGEQRSKSSASPQRSRPQTVTTSEENSPGQPIAGTQTLDRALLVLLQIAQSPPPGLTLAECTSILGYSKPTTLRMLRTLESRNFLRFDAELGVYTLGVANVQLGAEYLNRLDLRGAALPVMKLLVDDTKETAHLGTLTRTDVVYIEVVDSPEPVRVFSRVGAFAPAYASAVGKAILAWLPPKELEMHLPGALEARTHNTITTVDSLMAELARTRERGYAVDDQENRESIRSFAAPIFDFNNQVVAGVSIAGPVERIPSENSSALITKIIQAGAQISEALGSTR
jgi:IclR family acetate operon transcriptional repressor